MPIVSPSITLTLKSCGRCKESKPLHEFGVDSRSISGRKSHCRLCRADEAARYLADMTDEDQAQFRVRRAKVQSDYVESKQRYVIDYLRSHPCLDCGEFDIIVLEFDHVRGEKVDDVSRLVVSASRQKVIDEIDKCEVVCANCHRRRTAERACNYRWRITRANR